ncbi:hypothetical protein C8R48DRAFT_676787 [Suillus tomentosus]|nr:hypothetical protein C8R48DRAFT_676787 [Suillus tomentosus]
MPPDRARTGVADIFQLERQQAKLAARACDRKDAVLELDDTGETLCVWHWPVMDSGEHEDPSSHCEAAMVMLTQGAHAGEDVACCASSKCGYIVFIRQIHSSSGLSIKCYPRCGADEARPREITFLNGNDIKLADVMTRRQNRTYEVFDRLLKLDSFTRPGLTEGEFRHFLTRCNGCELIMTRRMFKLHNCVGRAETDTEVKFRKRFEPKMYGAVCGMQYDKIYIISLEEKDINKDYQNILSYWWRAVHNGSEPDSQDSSTSESCNTLNTSLSTLSNAMPARPDTHNTPRETPTPVSALRSFCTTFTDKYAFCPMLRALSADEANSEIAVASGLPEWGKT